MESILGIFKIGIGPSSSHTMGPWLAGLRFREELDQFPTDISDHRIVVDLYGSLALTGKGHGTDFAVFMGLSGFDIATVQDAEITNTLENYGSFTSIKIGDTTLHFSPDGNISFWKEEFLPFHPNGMIFRLINHSEELVYSKTFYSIGGGFIIGEDEIVEDSSDELFDPFFTTSQLIGLEQKSGRHLAELILDRESEYRSIEEIDSYLNDIYQVMLEATYNGCHKGGILPGGLQVSRRAKVMHDKLMTTDDYSNAHEWLEIIKRHSFDFRQTLEWINCFALAVNEQNASFGRVVTAPTNGASGVIPAVLLYILTQLKYPDEQRVIRQFLLVCAYIGMLYKRGATLSAAAGGCQAEIGVSASMAAAGLAAVQGARTGQVFMAAEIAMEHHLGLTCDPINGLVQVPCIERNSIGAIKAISSAQLAMASEPSQAKVSLEQVIVSMWETAQDMSHKYKETSLGGLAINVLLPEC